MPDLLRAPRWIAAAGLALVACAWATRDLALNNYDTAYALLWGRDLAGGRLPDYSVTLAPTPHPLATLFGALISLPGRGAVPSSETQVWIWMTLAYLLLLVLGALVFALGRAWFGPAAGAIAAVLVLTREPVLSYGLRAYVDIPYLVLLLAALLIETRRRHAGTSVLALLAVAGLLRPEAWLFAALYGVWLWRGGRLRPAHIALILSAPVLWALADLAVTGDPLHSLTGTREGAQELGRRTGVANVVELAPRRLGEIVREPVLLAAVGGIALGLWRIPRRAAIGVGALAAGLVAFAILGSAGLSIITRYLLFPGALLCIFAGAGIAGWLALARDDRGRRPWAMFAAVAAVAMVVFIPSQIDRIDRLDAALERQDAILTDLRAHFDAPSRCVPITLANRRAVPQVALWSGLEPGREVRSAQDDGIAGQYLQPASAAIAEDFVLDRADRDRRLPSSSLPIASTSRFWILRRPARCD